MMNKLEHLKEAVLKDYPRLDATDTFKFACFPGISCFNQCCSDVNIFLTPYDVLRLKNHLNISSQDFLDRYTQLVTDESQQLPAVQLRMSDDDSKQCYFVDSEKGCTVYENRPWSCRMYPIGQASPKEENNDSRKKFYFILREDVCKGFQEDTSWTISSWLNDQGVGKYDEFGELFKEIVFHDFFSQGKILTPKKVEMFYLACYNIDCFRDFIFNTTFLNRFDIDRDAEEGFKTDDETLLKFAFDWIKFSLFGENTIKINDKILEQAKDKITQS